MKKGLQIFLLSIFFSLLTGGAYAQYQLPNSGFEGTWNSVSQDGVSGTEPTGWHSFVSMQTGGSLYNSARTNKLEASSDYRPGSTGRQSAKIWSNAITVLFWSIVANGNLTTGRIYGGSTTATDASGNYNFSDPSESGYNQTFTGRPDSLVSWVKFVPKNLSEEARISAIIHENSRYQDPEATTYNNIVAKAQKNYKATSDKGWQRQSIPFVYESDSKVPAYILLSYSTNKTPGQGAADDAVYVDDIEMIYNSKIEAIDFDGTAFTDFDKDTYNYTDIVVGEGGLPSSVDVTVDGVSAAYETNFNADQNTVTVKVAGGDISSNPSNMHTYTFAFVSTHKVTVSVSSSTMGSAYIGTPGTTSKSVLDGGSITITAKANDGYKFTSWTVGRTTVSSSATYTVDNVTADIALTARFSAKTESNLAFEKDGDQTVDLDEAKFINMASSSNSQGKVTYAITASDKEGVATINSNTGEVTLLKEGGVTISATQDAWGDYLKTVKTYHLSIAPSGVEDSVLDSSADITIASGVGEMHILGVTEPLHADIYVISGKLVKSITISENTKVSVATGVYLVNIRNNKYSKVMKVVVR